MLKLSIFRLMTVILLNFAVGIISYENDEANENDRAQYMESIMNLEMSIIDPDNSYVLNKLRRIKLKDFYGLPSDLLKPIFEPGPELINFLQENVNTPIVYLSNRQIPSSYTHYYHIFPKLADIFSKISILRYKEKTQLIMLRGLPNSGKTQALKYIYEIFRNSKPTDLCIFVDLPHIITTKLLGRELTVNNILKSCISENLVQFVQNVLHSNPSKITFLFDGVDQVQYRALDTVQIIKDTLEMKAFVITTSNFDIQEKLLPKEQTGLEIIKFDSIEIPYNMVENKKHLRTYMTNYWIRKFNNLKNIKLDYQLVHDYYTAISIIMQDSPLPWNIRILEQLADYLSDTSIEKAIPDVSVYALKTNNQRPQLSEIIELARTMFFSKIKFYDKFFQNIKPLEANFYEWRALSILLDGVKRKPSIKSDLKNEKFIHVEASELYKYPYIRLDSTNRPIYSFLNEEYRYYFFAKKLCRSFTTDTPYISIFIEVLSESTNVFIAEYIDEAVEKMVVLKNPDSILWENVKLKLSEKRYKNYHVKIFSNLIKHSLDRLCSKVFEVMGPLTVKNYLHEHSLYAIENVHELVKVFGMIPNIMNQIKDESDINNIRNWVPRRVLTVNSHETILSMIFKHNMQRTIDITIRFQFKWPNALLIINAALQSNQILEQMLRRLITVMDENTLQILNIAGIGACKKFGPRSIDILRTLSKFGAQFSNAVDASKRTLAHVAVEWADLNLLKVIHEELHVPLIDSCDAEGKTILFTALDSSPSQIWTPDGFWPMMEYLVKNADLKYNYEILKFEDASFSYDNDAFFENLYYTVMLTGTPENLITTSRAVFQCVPLKDWDLPQPLLSGRRKIVLKNSRVYLNSETSETSKAANQAEIDFITISEIIIKHRSLDILSEISQQAYENTVEAILFKDIIFNEHQLKRIFISILKNTRTHLEFVKMQNIYYFMMNSGQIPKKLYPMINTLFDLRKNGDAISLTNAMHYSDHFNRVINLKTIFDENPYLINDESNSNHHDLTTSILTREMIEACVDILNL